MTKTPTIADRVEALEALLTQKGIVTSEQLDSIVARYADQVGPLNGARLIARAWTDPEFKARLLDDATSIVHEWKLEGGQVDRLIVKENTRNIHIFRCLFAIQTMESQLQNPDYQQTLPF